MGFNIKKTALAFSFFLHFAIPALVAQSGGIKWSKDGNSYYQTENGEIVRYDLPAFQRSSLVSQQELTPSGLDKALQVRSFSFSDDNNKVLIFTNTKKVWRYQTRGDYWVLDKSTKQLKKLGKSRPESTLMFAKFSPDGKRVAYVSEHNIYVENLSNGEIKALTTTNGTPKLINGTFDWVYEEEFALRDGFRWNADGKKIAYWQIDANKVRDFYMINNTDSIYSRLIPVEYPKVGQLPSPARIGVVDVGTGKTTWMKIDGDPQLNYLARMEWTLDGQEVVVQQLNRRQNESKIVLCNAGTGAARVTFFEKDEAWVSHVNEWSQKIIGWDWINKGNDFLWVSEKDGWRHIYRIARDGKKEALLTPGDFDATPVQFDEKSNTLYFYASPSNATQQYLFKSTLDGSGKVTQVSPTELPGQHEYNISPNGKYALHEFSNYYTEGLSEWLTLPEHTPIKPEEDIKKLFNPKAKDASNISFFQVTTEDGVTMDGWLVKPNNFDPQKKYPVLFTVYGEPASTTVNDNFGGQGGALYQGDMAADGYVQISLDNRGTPAPKGRTWRKAIYSKLGQINIRDQAMGAKKILEWPYIDKDRVAVWGWSGGGSSTLNLLFQYPDIYKTGISVAPVTNSLFYDNIYTERYMGLPEENKADYLAGAAITHAKNLKGKLLLVHGTGDDNVHYQNSEALVNELIKQGKLFQFMPYPNRTHGIFEGEGTRKHLSSLFTEFLRNNCPPGAKK
jgi:dipeptidyl-peptidase-4